MGSSGTAVYTLNCWVIYPIPDASVLKKNLKYFLYVLHDNSLHSQCCLFYWSSWLSASEEFPHGFFPFPWPFNSPSRSALPQRLLMRCWKRLLVCGLACHAVHTTFYILLGKYGLFLHLAKVWACHWVWGERYIIPVLFVIGNTQEHLVCLPF